MLWFVRRYSSECIVRAGLPRPIAAVMFTSLMGLAILLLATGGAFLCRSTISAPISASQWLYPLPLISESWSCSSPACDIDTSNFSVGRRSAIRCIRSVRHQCTRHNYAACSFPIPVRKWVWSWCALRFVRKTLIDNPKPVQKFSRCRQRPHDKPGGSSWAVPKSYTGH